MLAPLAAPFRESSPVFTREEALAAGHTVDAIRHRLETGTWRRLRRGIYVDGSQWIALGTDPARQLTLSVAAVQRCLNVPTWAAGLTAAALHGADVLAPPPALRLVTENRSGRRRGPGYAVVSVVLPLHHRCGLDGVALTSTARTLVDVARTATAREAVVVADSLLRTTRVRPEELTRVLTDLCRATGIARAVRIVGFADGRAESALESISRLAFAGQNLCPEPQVWIHDRDGRRARVDFLFRDEWVVVETDGLAKYTDARALKEEKLRQEWLEQLGFAVVRVTWHEVDGAPDATAARIRDGFVHAAGARVAAAVTSGSFRRAHPADRRGQHRLCRSCAAWKWRSVHPRRGR